METENLNEKSDLENEEKITLEELQTKNKELEEKVAKLNNASIALSYALDQLKLQKRTLENNMQNSILEAKKQFIDKAVFPVLDLVEIAVKAAQNAQDVDMLKQGLEMGLSSVVSSLSNTGITEIKTDIGQEADPNLHEVVELVDEESDFPFGSIVEVKKQGYKLDDKVIRTVQVAVKVKKKDGE
jgi:molecular chaperone GrpE